MNREAWYVLHSKPHKECQLNSYLQSQGIETFFPALKVKPVNPRAAKLRPLFPNYLFVHVDLDVVGQSALQWIPGAIRLVAFDGYPATVPDHVIRQLRTQLKDIEYAAGNPLDGIQRGDLVRITKGPLAGYAAIFDMRLSGAERVQVMLDLLGRLVKTQMNASAIEKNRGQ